MVAWRWFLGSWPPPSVSWAAAVVAASLRVPEARVPEAWAFQVRTGVATPALGARGAAGRSRPEAPTAGTMGWSTRATAEPFAAAPARIAHRRDMIGASSTPPSPFARGHPKVSACATKTGTAEPIPILAGASGLPWVKRRATHFRERCAITLAHRTAPSPASAAFSSLTPAQMGHPTGTADRTSASTAGVAPGPDRAPPACK